MTIEPFNSQMIGLAELALAFAYLHRALPAVRALGRGIQIKFWLLAVALGLFGIGRFFGPVYETAFTPVFNIGHYALIAYAALRLHQIIYRSPCRWGKEP